MNQDQRTVILFFSRSLQDEFLAKPFGLSQQRFRTLYNCLLKKARTTLSSVDLDVIESFSDNQEGNSFRDRLSHAVSAVFSQGYHNILIVGNDAPCLTGQHLLEAKALLQQGKNVIAPDNHGGAYLIGITKHSFTQRDFDNINWGTASVFNQLKSTFNAEVIGEELIDLNSRGDLFELVNAKNSLPLRFKVLLRTICTGDHLARDLFIKFFQDLTLRTKSQRGPPLVVAA
jgi:2-phospho-L-lactate guanylyltransferase (CobY/MobA/RfbA family)